MSGNTLTITDNRTGKRYDVPIENGTIKAMDLRQIKTSDDDFGLMTYDPAFMNTASCKSRITFIDGDKGILEYRGYPIDQLAEQSTYLEVAYLLLHGELPTTKQLADFQKRIAITRRLPEPLRDLLKAPGFGRTAPFSVKAVYATPGGDFQKQRFKTHLADVIAAQTRFDTTALGPFVDRIKAARVATS